MKGAFQRTTIHVSAKWNEDQDRIQTNIGPSFEMSTNKLQQTVGEGRGNWAKSNADTIRGPSHRPGSMETMKISLSRCRKMKERLIKTIARSCGIPRSVKLVPDPPAQYHCLLFTELQ